MGGCIAQFQRASAHNFPLARTWSHGHTQLQGKLGNAAYLCDQEEAKIGLMSGQSSSASPLKQDLPH